MKIHSTKHVCTPKAAASLKPVKTFGRFSWLSTISLSLPFGTLIKDAVSIQSARPMQRLFQYAKGLSSLKKECKNLFRYLGKPAKQLIYIIPLIVALQTTAQETRFKLDVEEATIVQIIDQLRSQSEINFIYNHEEVGKYEPVTIKISGATLEEVLSTSLKNTGLTYKLINSTVVITPIKENPESKSSLLGLTQTVRGQILDIDSQTPLIGATVLIAGTNPPIGAITDIDGNFRLQKVPVGRVNLALSYVGYKNKTVSNVVINSGKEVVLELGMQESAVKMKELIITASDNKGETINDMVMVSGRSVSTEETSRYAGAFSDPSRILASFAGVTTSQNAENDIIVRGNSPKYIQWRLEGLEITNPSHFGDQNGIKGGISALNNNLLATSDFYTGAFSPEYGNALSGVYDAKLRSGNNEKFESAIGIGLLGTDVTLEGPFKKGYGGSYLVNYRYSTIALINDLGLVDVDGALSYQDATFKVNLPTKNIGTFSFFGLGGLSGFKIEDYQPDGQAVPDNGILRENIREDYNKANYLVNLGMNHTLSLDKKSFLNTSLSYSNTSNREDTYDNATIKTFDSTGAFKEDSVVNRNLSYRNRLSDVTIRAAMTYNRKINARNKFQVGTKYELFNYDYEQSQFQNETNSTFTLIDFDESVSVIRNFVSWKHQFNDDISLVTGLHNVNVLLNNKHTLEPRAAVNWKITKTSSVQFGYGNHSKTENIHNYFAKVEQENGDITEPNRDLDLLKAHHYVLGLEKQFNENLKGKVELYYQDLYNLPVANDDTSYYATVNEGTDFRYVDLVNKGTGKNYGVEVTLERFFSNSYYYLINGSLYESKYKSLENVERNTQYNGRFLLNALAGKELTNLGRKDNQSLALNGKLFLGGGRRIIPLLRDEQGNLNVDPENNRFWDYEKAYDNKLDDIFQLNVSMSYKWNKPKATHELFIDLVNITNNSGRVFEYYDESEPGDVGYVRQFSFFPNLMYRAYF
ncbi:MAG: carboxypeptidase-like regulatory domain-containing protein [Cyclobacteriaceae bacterium]